jgi:hypothetical protein
VHRILSVQVEEVEAQQVETWARILEVLVVEQVGQAEAVAEALEVQEVALVA